MSRLNGAAGFGASLILFSRSPIILLSIFFTFLCGFANSQYTSQDQTIIQMLAAPEVRGRVLGVYLLNRGLMPIGSLFAGLLAQYLGGPWAVTIMGISCVVIAIAIAIAVPDIWRSRLLPDSGSPISGGGPRPAPAS